MAERKNRTYSVPVPAELDAQVRADMASSGFNSLSEYVRDALRARLERSARRRLEAQLAQAAERGDYEEAGADSWTRLRDLARDGGAGAESAERRLEQVLSTLRAHKAGLRRRGVIHAAVFGSTARGEATAASDVDIVVDIDPERSLGVFEFVSITRYLQELIPRADVVERKALKPRVRERVVEEAVDAF